MARAMKNLAAQALLSLVGAAFILHGLVMPLLPYAGERAAAEITAAQPWLTAHRWQAQVTMVGSPPRTRVVVVEPTQKG